MYGFNSITYRTNALILVEFDPRLLTVLFKPTDVLDTKSEDITLRYAREMCVLAANRVLAFDLLCLALTFHVRDCQILRLEFGNHVRNITVKTSNKELCATRETIKNSHAKMSRFLEPFIFGPHAVTFPTNKILGEI